MIRRSSIIVVLASSLACTAAQRGDDRPATTGKTAAAGKDEHAMKSFETQTLATGFMLTRGAAGGRGVVVAITSAEEWIEFARTMQDEMLLDLDEVLRGPPSFHPGREALLFVEFPDRSGTEFTPVVDGFERTDTTGRVHGHFAVNPEGEMTDDLNRTWVLVKLPAAALDGGPPLSLELAKTPSTVAP